MERCDVVVVGAGPTGLACGIELEQRGLKTILIEKGCVVNSIYNYPTHMVFFTTPELLEIGNLPMTSLNEKPGRTEALKYYRRVAEHYSLNIHQYERVLSIEGGDGDFHVSTSRAEYRARKIVLATGYYDLANMLNVPGEELDKVIHYYKEPHPYYNHDVAVIGAKNSAAIEACAKLLTWALKARSVSWQLQNCWAAVARHFRPLLVNSVVGFIGPEYLFNGKEIMRAGLEDHFCGKLLGLPMGCDVCYTNHAEADQDDMDALLTLLGVAGCNYIMGVPGADDVMLSYQSSSFHDALYLRRLLGKRPAPEFEAWLERIGITDATGNLAGPEGPDAISAPLRRLLAGLA